MIDLGLSKLIVIGIVVLVAIGPKRLPMAARTFGTLLGRAQRYLNQVKAEVSREIELDTLRNLQHDFTQTAASLHQNLRNSFTETLIDDSSLTSNTVTLHQTIQRKKNKKRFSTCRKQTVFAHQRLKKQNLNPYLLSGAARVKRYRRFSSINRDFFSDF